MCVIKLPAVGFNDKAVTQNEAISSSHPTAKINYIDEKSSGINNRCYLYQRVSLPLTLKSVVSLSSNFAPSGVIQI